MAERPDAFDVKELQSAVNDSATRVSAIWVSFLIFALYLLIAATMVTQKQLLLAEPVKLPVLNIDLPLWGFFFLAPILFVILHVYILLQVLLLGRTAAAYDDAVGRVELSPEENTLLRQRLTNTLFAQIFAGSPREREGFIGWLLRTIVWITLAIAPILVVLAFQFKFLPYHSHFVTWTHRLLILVELFAFVLIWPLALDAGRNFQTPKVWANLKRLTVIPLQLFGPKEVRHEAWLWVREQALPLLACILYLLIPLSLATFPGEPHLNLFTGEALTSVQCNRWLQRNFDLIDLQFDRLSDLPQHPFEGERTYILRNRDLNCGVIAGSDLRRVDLIGSSLKGTLLQFTDLQGANLYYANLQGAVLADAQLQGAVLAFAQLQGAVLAVAQLQGADLSHAELQGAVLAAAQLQGADLGEAQLQGADLSHAELQGADLSYAELQGAVLVGAQLQDADLSHAELQGADLREADLGRSVLAQASIWRARNATYTNARIADPVTSNVIEVSELVRSTGNWGVTLLSRGDKLIPATPDAIAEFIERSTSQIPVAGNKAKVADRMREGLVINPARDDAEAISKVWRTCEKAETSTMPQEKFDEKRAAVLRDLVCNASENRKAIADGIIRNWVFRYQFNPSVLSVQLARGLLKECAATKDFDNATMSKLKEAAAAKVIPAKTPEK